MSGRNSTIRQDANGFKHVSLLRKLILEKRSGTAWFGGEGWRSEIAFERGAVADDVAGHISRILSEPVLQMGWERGLPHSRRGILPIPVRHIVSKAIATMDLPVRRMLVYRRKFESLPNIRLRYMPVFRSNPVYQRRFQVLYQMSLSTSGASLEDYFATAIDIAELRMRVNIVIAAYCLGDMVPADAPEPAAATTTAGLASGELARANVVSRILTRLREGRSV